MTKTEAIIKHIKTKGFYAEYYGNSVLNLAECDEVAEGTGIARTVILREFYKREK